MGNSTLSGKPSRRSRPMRGARISRRTRAKSPIGATPGFAAIAPRPNTRIEPTRLRVVSSLPVSLRRQYPHPPSPSGWVPPSPALRERGPSAARRVRKPRLATVGLVRFAALVLLLLAAAVRAFADDFATLVSALGADSFAEKEQAVVALGKLGEGRAVPVLTALRDGLLLRAPDGRVLIGGTTKLTDAATGVEVADVAADGLDRIRVNNRLRGAIEGALGGLTL